jgi:hypothetical protein
MAYYCHIAHSRRTNSDKPLCQSRTSLIAGLGESEQIRAQSSTQSVTSGAKNLQSELEEEPSSQCTATQVEQTVFSTSAYCPLWSVCDLGPAQLLSNIAQLLELCEPSDFALESP